MTRLRQLLRRLADDYRAWQADCDRLVLQAERDRAALDARQAGRR